MLKSATGKPNWTKVFNIAVLVASLGYFVDIYDLLLFSIVRIKSLTDLGISGSELTSKGLFLINAQMGGMLIGGIVFGILGDKKGRLSILFGSIILYSIANILNGFVQSFEGYVILRFIAGVGLAGELGAGVSLVTETLPKEIRGLGTTLIASVGVCGAVLAWFVFETFTWRSAYFIGGGFGILLLLLRIGVFESGLFAKMKTSSQVRRGDFLSLFTNADRFKRFILCILIGAQFWFVVGVLITLSPEFARALGVLGPIEAGKAVMYCYSGLVIGDLASGLLSHFMKSRKKALLIFIVLSGIAILGFSLLRQVSTQEFYGFCFGLGLTSGYWALFVTVAAESFGTNLRATVSTSVPNFVRGSLVPISMLFAFLKGPMGLMPAAMTVGMICFAISLVAILNFTDTFSKDLDYYE